MQCRRFRRVTLAAVVAATLAATLLSVGPASAAAKGVTCTSLSGNVSQPDTVPVFTLGGCTGTTGGSGTAQGSTITWANGRLTYLQTPAFTPSDKGKPRKGNCASLSDKWAVRDVVAGDTTGSLKSGGKVSAEVCILNESPDPWSLAPGSVFRLL
jgi:hypothetical protein